MSTITNGINKIRKIQGVSRKTRYDGKKGDKRGRVGKFRIGSGKVV